MRTKPKLPILQRGHPLTRGLIGAWLMYEGSGTIVYDLSPYRRHGTIAGNPVWGVDTPGRVLTFDGTGDNVTFSAVGLPVADAPYTLLARFKSTGATLTGTKGLIGYGNSGTSLQANRLRLLADNEVIAGTTLGLVNYWWAFDLRARSTLPRQDIWYTAAATYDQTTRSLLVNGNVIGSDTPASNHDARATNAAFGASSANNEVFVGSIAFAGIWNRALTPAEVRALHTDPYQAFRLRSAHIGALTASEVATTTVRLTWQDNSNDEDGFVIERSTDGVAFDVVDTVAAGTTQYDDEELPTGTTFYYRVRAYNDDGNSDYSNVAQVTTAE